MKRAICTWHIDDDNENWKVRPPVCTSFNDLKPDDYAFLTLTTNERGEIQLALYSKINGVIYADLDSEDVKKFRLARQKMGCVHVGLSSLLDFPEEEGFGISYDDLHVFIESALA